MGNFNIGDFVTIKGDDTHKVWEILAIPLKPELPKFSLHMTPKDQMYLLGEPDSHGKKHERSGLELISFKPKGTE